MVLARLHTPSWRQGSARYRRQSAYPDLWDGLVAAWLPALGPTGSVLRDISRRGNHGILTDMDPATDWVATGRKGLASALEFVKAAGMVHIKLITVTAAEGNSFGFWFKCTPGMEVHYPLSRLDLNDSYFNLFSPTSHFWRDFSGNYYNWYPSGGSINTLDGKWHWICCTQDADYTRLYIDGREITPAQITVAGSYTLWEAIGESVDGQLSNTVIYNRVLAPAEIQLLCHDPMALVRRRATVFPAAGPDVTAVTGSYNVAAGLPYVTGSVAGDVYTTGSVAGALT